MALTYVANVHTAEEYADAFAKAKALEYPEIDALEAELGYAIDRDWLNDAGRVLSCPIKAVPPQWQHGRVLYAVARHYIATHPESLYHVLDIGTAKGFSALCLQKVFRDAGVLAKVASVDVMPPTDRCLRNSVAELDGLKTLAEILAPWPESRDILFVKSTGVEWLNAGGSRIHVAFIDGKHTSEAVRAEGKLLAARQQSGDLAIFDDCQMARVSVAVVSLEQWYRIKYVKAEPREYAIARRR